MYEAIPYFTIIMKSLFAILIGILLGNAAVFVFNKLPAKWLTDYGKEPSEELLDPYTQRIKSYPWKFAFSMLFVAAGVYLIAKDVRFGIAVLAVLWIVLEVAIADWKYRIIPDQLVVLLLISYIGIMNRHSLWPSAILGLLLGFAIMSLVSLVGYLIFRRPAVGGGDIKMMAALGFVVGIYGIVTIYILATAFTAIHYAILIMQRKHKKGKPMPFAPYVFIATTIYLIFLWGKPEMLINL